MKAIAVGIVFAAASLAAGAQQQYEPRTLPSRYNDVMTPVVFRDLAGVREILALGKWPDKPDSLGQTPLLVAFQLRESEIARALIEAGAEPERALIAARRTGDYGMIALLEQHASIGSGIAK